jgi:hypothetical protein
MPQQRSFVKRCEEQLDHKIHIAQAHAEQLFFFICQLTRNQCLNYSLQQHWTNIFSANITVTDVAISIRVHDARTLRKGDVIQIDNYFGSGRAAVQENSESVFALKGTKLWTTSAHTWEFVPLQGGAATRLVQRETWSEGVSFLSIRFGPVRSLLEEMFAAFNGEVKRSAEGAE